MGDPTTDLLYGNEALNHPSWAERVNGRPPLPTGHDGLLRPARKSAWTERKLAEHKLRSKYKSKKRTGEHLGLRKDINGCWGGHKRGKTSRAEFRFASLRSSTALTTEYEMPFLTASDLIFSEQANHNFSKTLGDLKRSTLSIQNRLQSIEHDAAFAQKVAGVYNRALIANERCGSWYIDPEIKGGSAYFKSTDGHTGVWKFSSRRLNLHLLEIIGKHDGCIIVDSTRRGKRMPDALSKTIPIWCSVLNRYLFPTNLSSHQLYTPPQVVSESEHAQISALLPSFVIALRALKLPLADFRQYILKPLRPIWVTPESDLTPASDIFEDYHPVICCTVSRRVAGGEVSEGGYIQGAGDDTENWAHGLTPPVFWANKQRLLRATESELPDLIEELVSDSLTISAAMPPRLRCVKPTSNLFIGMIPGTSNTEAAPDSCTITLQSNVTEQSTWRTSSTRLDAGLGSTKLGSRNLRLALPILMAFVEDMLWNQKPNDTSHSGRIVIACETGKDLAFGVALATLCLFFDDHGQLLDGSEQRATIDKSFIRSRLGWISTSMPDANPRRATLQSVNSFLMNRPQ